MSLHIIEEENDKNTFVCYLPNFLKENDCLNKLEWLSKMNDFIPSKSYNGNISRYQKWYHEDNKYFCNKWDKKHDKWKSFNYDDELKKIQKIVQEKINNLNLEDYGFEIPKINSCLINKYRTGNDYIAPHCDTNLSFGEYPTIIGLSLGSPRNLIFKRMKKYSKNNCKDESLQLRLESGSLFIMGGSSQKYYTHEIPIEETDDTRFSLTFREFIQKDQ